MTILELRTTQRCSECAARGLRATPLLPARPTVGPKWRRTLCRPRNAVGLVTEAFAGAAAPALSASAGVSLSTSIMSFFSFAVGSLGLVLLLADQWRQPGPDPECSTCEGTGLVPCVCRRWSDGDSGCSICSGAGLMSCPSCGGGGTAVPIAARAHIQRQAQQYRDL